MTRHHLDGNAIAADAPMLPHNRDKKLKEFAAMWLRGPVPADLMADLADILEDEDYTPEKRAHQIVWQAIKWGMEQ